MPANTASQLRAVLPAVAARLDLTKLTAISDNFVDEDLTWRHSDLLFTAPLTNGHDAYVLIEHQSTHDPLMPYRMLRYVTRIWDKYELDNPHTRRLPAVIPLVVYQGPHPWTSPTQLADLIDPDTEYDMRAWLPRFEFRLDDLTHAEEHELQARDLTADALVVLLLLKTARGNPHLAADLWRWSQYLRAVLDQPGGTQTFSALLTYIEQVGEIKASELRDLVASLGPDAQEAYMTIADTFRAEGRREGEARGKAEGKAEAILMVFEQRGIHISDSSREQIQSCTDLDTLNNWFRRAFTIDKATDLFEQ